MNGRPSKELDIAVIWLEKVIARGPISSQDVEKLAPVSMQTMHKAKKKLGLVSKQTAHGWMWQFADQKLINLPQVVEQEQDDTEPYRVDTKEIITGVNGMILMGKELPEIVRELVLSCAQYPMPKPYSRAYIESVARHAIDGTPIRTDLNENNS